MRILICLASIMVLMFGCAKESQKSEAVTNPNLDSSASETKVLKTRLALDTAKVNLDSISFISLKEGTYEGHFDLYNLDNTFWKSFYFGDGCCGSSIAPYSIKSDYSHLIFRVVGRTNNAYIIVADEAKNIQKLFNPIDTSFNYYTWEELILNTFAVGLYEGDTATLRSSPSYSAKVLPYDRNLIYTAVEFKDEWLKIRDENDLEGWVKWRDGKGEVLIELFFLC
jgi:hypothetical protein